MPRQSRTEREIRDLHGDDAEIIEIDSNRQPTGRSYRVVSKKPVPLAGLDPWIKWPLLLLIFVIASALGIIAIGGFLVSVRLMWWGLTGH